MRTSPTEDNLSPSFWTCFSHYHEKVATLRSAFFDITHSERKKHSSLLGVLFDGDAPAPKKTSLVVRDVFEGDETQRKKKALLFVWSAFDGDAPRLQKKRPPL